MAEHNTISDPEIHEPKGASTASSGEVYISNGAGSGAWGSLTSSSLDSTDITSFIQGKIDDESLSLNPYFVAQCIIEDISTGSSTAYIAIPNACTFVSASSVLEGAIATADDTITFFNVGDNCGGSMTVAYTGSAAGDVDTYTPSANTTFTAGSYLKVVSDGASTNTIKLFVTCIFQLT